MMGASNLRWCKRFDTAVNPIPEIERKLFQMGIHEQSLFPDMQGLAGLRKGFDCTGTGRAIARA